MQKEGTVFCVLRKFNYWVLYYKLLLASDAQREVIAAGGGTLSDTLHIAWAMMTLLFNMLLMGYGAAALGRRFRIYTFATWVVFIIFGVLTFMESRASKQICRHLT
jgi:amino acid transporter